MKPLPSDPVARQARTMNALCNDLFDIGAGKSNRFERLDALHHLSSKGAGAAQEAARSDYGD